MQYVYDYADHPPRFYRDNLERKLLIPKFLFNQPKWQIESIYTFKFLEYILYTPQKLIF